MRILVTNDDGIDSRGLHTLATVASDSGATVVVAAPSGERSGASASLSALAEGDRLITERRELAGLPGVIAYAVEATPALIALVAGRGAFGDRPDVLLSGINHGPNAGTAVVHSGTVGAALTANAGGLPAMAVSLASAEPTAWDTAAVVADHALRWLIEHGDPHWTLNINVPNVPVGQLKGIRAAQLASFGAVQADIGQIDESYVTVTFSEIQPGASDPDVGSLADGDSDDASLVAAGWATATAIRLPSAVPGVDLAGLTGTDLST